MTAPEAKPSWSFFPIDSRSAKVSTLAEVVVHTGTTLSGKACDKKTAGDTRGEEGKEKSVEHRA